MKRVAVGTVLLVAIAVWWGTQDRVAQPPREIAQPIVVHEDDAPRAPAGAVHEEVRPDTSVPEIPTMLAAVAEDSWPCFEGICSMARACVDGRCVACEAHEQCLADELCVTGRCVPRSNVECEGSSDCVEPEATCFVSGVTGTRRGNEEMRSYCLAPSGGTKPTETPAPEVIAAPGASVAASDRLDARLEAMF